MKRFDELACMLPNVEIAYGAWQSFDNIYAKHCFFVMDGEIIDPTYFTSNEENDYRNYFVFKTYDIQSYLFALVDCQGETYLGKYNEQMYIDMKNEMYKEGLRLLG